MFMPVGKKNEMGGGVFFVQKGGKCGVIFVKKWKMGFFCKKTVENGWGCFYKKVENGVFYCKKGKIGGVL